MQIFLPYADMKKSLQCLDNKRLGKQRVETHQILNVLLKRPKLDGKPYKGWLNHPCVVMWKDYVPSLKKYYNLSIQEWIGRGFKNTMKFEDISETNCEFPSWFGNERFHSSHRANLLKKYPEYYSKYNWKENPNDPYVWLDSNGKWYEQHSGINNKLYIEYNY
jgi:hypothetical protein